VADEVRSSMEYLGGSALTFTRAHRFKTSFMFLPVEYGRSWDALDTVKAADYVLFLLSTTVEVDDKGDTLLRTLQAQGLPTVISAVPPNSFMPSTDQKSRTATLKSLLSFMQYFDPSQTRVYDLSISADTLNVLRSVSEGHPGEVRWRAGRSWVVGEEVQWEEGTLKVTGVVRGARLSANRLVHIPNFGDYQLSKVCTCRPVVQNSEQLRGRSCQPPFATIPTSGQPWRSSLRSFPNAMLPLQILLCRPMFQMIWPMNKRGQPRRK